MPVTETLATTDLEFARQLGQQLRVDSIRCSTAAGSGHPTSSMSAAVLQRIESTRSCCPSWRANSRSVVARVAVTVISLPLHSRVASLPRPEDHGTPACMALSLIRLGFLSWRGLFGAKRVESAVSIDLFGARSVEPPFTGWVGETMAVRPRSWTCPEDPASHPN